MPTRIPAALFVLCAVFFPAYGAADEEEGTEREPTVVVNSSSLRDFSLTLPIYAPESAWNQRADTAAVLPESDAQIRSLFRVLLGDITTLEGYDAAATTWPYMDVNTYEFSIPIYRAGTENQTVTLCEDEGVSGWALPQFGIDTEGGPVTVPAPAGISRPAGPENDDADGHLVLIDVAAQTEFDYFAATMDGTGECSGFRGGSVGRYVTSAGVVAFFDLGGLGVSPDNSYSARAVGTPLLAGLIIPEDIIDGAIHHALALAIPGPRNTSRDPFTPVASDVFYPATTTETDFYNTDPRSLAAGQRLRLKSTLVDDDGQKIDESEFAPITRIFLTALREYGAIIVDNAGGFSFYAEDIHTANLAMSDAEINALIGQEPGALLPEDATAWQVVIEQLGNDLERIPFAISPGDDEPRPSRAEIEAANFEVVTPAAIP